MLEAFVSLGEWKSRLVFNAYNLGEAISTVEREGISTVGRWTWVPKSATAFTISVTQGKLLHLPVLQFPVL